MEAYKLLFSLFGPMGDITRSERYFELREDAETQQLAFEKNCQYPHSCSIEKITIKESGQAKQTYTDGWFTALWAACEVLAKENCNRQVKHILNETGVSIDEIEKHRPAEMSTNLKLILEDYYKKFIPR